MASGVHVSPIPFWIVHAGLRSSTASVVCRVVRSRWTAGVRFWYGRSGSKPISLSSATLLCNTR